MHILSVKPLRLASRLIIKQHSHSVKPLRLAGYLARRLIILALSYLTGRSVDSVFPKHKTTEMLTFSSPDRSGLLFSSLLNFCFFAGISFPAAGEGDSTMFLFSLILRVVSAYSASVPALSVREEARATPTHPRNVNVITG